MCETLRDIDKQLAAPGAPLWAKWRARPARRHQSAGGPATRSQMGTAPPPPSRAWDVKSTRVSTPTPASAAARSARALPVANVTDACRYEGRMAPERRLRDGGECRGNERLASCLEPKVPTLHTFFLMRFTASSENHASISKASTVARYPSTNLVTLPVRLDWLIYMKCRPSYLHHMHRRRVVYASTSNMHVQGESCDGVLARLGQLFVRTQLTQPCN